MDVGDTLSLTGVQNPTNGTVQVVGNNVVFTPTTNFTGAASFQYSVSDGNGGTATGTVNVTVGGGGNANPVAVNDTLVTGEFENLTVTHSRLLANDTDADVGDTLTLTGVQNLTNGTVTRTADTVIFSPANGFTGTATFQYTIGDGNGGSATATASVDVRTVTDGMNSPGVFAFGNITDQVIVGTSGFDTIDGLGGNDLVYAGAGDDILFWDSSDISRVDGGTGTDTLKLAASGDTLNLTTVNNTAYYGLYTGIEIIDLRGSGDNSLILTVNDVLNLSDSLDRLTVEANSGDSVAIGSGWTPDGDKGSYQTYISTDITNDAELYIHNDIEDADVTVT